MFYYYCYCYYCAVIISSLLLFWLLLVRRKEAYRIILLISNAKVSYILLGISFLFSSSLFFLFYEGVRQCLKAGFFKRGGNVTVLGHRHLPHLILLTGEMTPLWKDQIAFGVCRLPS